MLTLSVMYDLYLSPLWCYLECGLVMVPWHFVLSISKKDMFNSSIRFFLLKRKFNCINYTINYTIERLALSTKVYYLVIFYFIQLSKASLMNGKKSAFTGSHACARCCYLSQLLCLISCNISMLSKWMSGRKVYLSSTFCCYKFTSSSFHLPDWCLFSGKILYTYIITSTDESIHPQQFFLLGICFFVRHVGLVATHLPKNARKKLLFVTLCSSNPAAYTLLNY